VAGEVLAVTGAGLHQPDHQVEHAREDPVAQQGPGDGSGRVDGGRVESAPLVVGSAVMSNPLHNCRFLLSRIALERVDVVTATTPLRSQRAAILGYRLARTAPRQSTHRRSRGGWPSDVPALPAAAASTAPTSPVLAVDSRWQASEAGGRTASAPTTQQERNDVHRGCAGRWSWRRRERPSQR
jgi:hypothetical protein